MENQTLVKLNIVMTYPVSWSEYMVAGNYIQNFYDALGKDHFATDFRYTYEGGVLTMVSKGSFAKEWLLYMGASKKRDEAGYHAGGFGEGFKIASLISIRDFGMDVIMESGDWRLSVTSVPGMIGTKKADFLAYKIGSRHDQDNSILRLENVSEGFFKAFEYEISSFYYRGNKHFGRCIIETEDYSIFESIKDPKELYHFGYVYASYERRKCIRIPLIICNHSFKPFEDDRGRSDFTETQTCRCVNRVFERLDARISLEILEYFRPSWGGRKKKYHNDIDWTPVLKTLIRNIETDPDTVEEFKSRYQLSLIIRDRPVDESDRWKRKVALLWFRNSTIRDRYRYVIHEFRSLGIRTVCDLCQEMDGYVLEREADKLEQCRISVLERAARHILSDLILVEKWPGCKVLKFTNAPVEGYTTLWKGTVKKNPYGLKRIAQTEYVYLQSYLFKDDGFSRAFSTYAHELLHEYGGDSSSAFHKALHLMNKKILINIDQFREYEEEWKKYSYE